MLDAFENKYDCAVIVTNDSDLVFPVKHIIEKFKKQVVLLILGKYISKQLKAVIKEYKEFSVYRIIRETSLKRYQFPVELEDKEGLFRKP